MKKSDANRMSTKMNQFFNEVQKVKTSDRTIDIKGIRISRKVENIGAKNLLELRERIRKLAEIEASDRDLRPSQALDLETWALANMAEKMSKHSRYLITGFMHGHYSKAIQDKVLLEIHADLENYAWVKSPSYWGTLEGYWDKEDWELAKESRLQEAKKAINDAKAAYRRKANAYLTKIDAQ